jgi:hypothetical protein
MLRTISVKQKSFQKWIKMLNLKISLEYLEKSIGFIAKKRAFRKFLGADDINKKYYSCGDMV